MKLRRSDRADRCKGQARSMEITVIKRASEAADEDGEKRLAEVCAASLVRLNRHLTLASEGLTAAYGKTHQSNRWVRLANVAALSYDSRDSIS